jgi:FkbM family methyltransferase
MKKVIDGFEISYRPGTADEDVLDHSFHNDIFMGSIPEYKPTASDIVIDVGAHIGTFSLLLSRVITQGKIFAVEASAETFLHLENNILGNNLRQVVPCHLALSDHNGTARLYHDLHAGNWGHSLTAQLSDEWELVQCESLEQFFDRRGVTCCNLLKLNCEGAEFRILLNAPVELLKRIRHLLVLYHEDLERSHTLSELQAHLQSAGFLVRLRHNTGARGWMICLRATPGNYFKFLFNDVTGFLRRKVSDMKKLLRKVS